MQLYKHQTDALAQTEQFNRVGYFLDMGLGKTFVGAEKMMDLGKRVNLLVCQKSKIDDWVAHFKDNYGCAVFDLTNKTDLNYFMDCAVPKDPNTGTVPLNSRPRIVLYQNGFLTYKFYM